MGDVLLRGIAGSWSGIGEFFFSCGLRTWVWNGDGLNEG